MKYKGLEITRTDYETIIEENKVKFTNFELELAPTDNYSWEDVDILVRRFKFDRLSEEELSELELEIFRANYLWLKSIAYKNTYIVRGYNEEDIITCMWFAHSNLLKQFKIIKFETTDEKIRKTKSQISFRYFLKKYFASRFHRFFVEGTKDFKGNHLAENNIKKNISATSYEDDYTIYDKKQAEILDNIEVSDINIREEIKKEIRASLPKDIADSILIYFKLLKRNNRTAHLKKHTISRNTKNNLWRLRSNKKLRELFDYYLKYIKD